MGKTVVLTGPSCGGKTTLQKMLLGMNDKFVVVNSYTTRPPREEDSTYHYVTETEFDDMKLQGKFAETSEYVGYQYGTLAEDLYSWMESGSVPVKVVNLEGALAMKEILGRDVITIFVAPPSRNAVKERMFLRDQTLDYERLDLLPDELAKCFLFDYVLVNDKLERCFPELQEIINSNLGVDMHAGKF